MQEKDKIEKYIEKYIVLAKKTGDYSREGVKINNKAMKEIYKMYMEFKTNIKLADAVLSSLIIHEDDKVKTIAVMQYLNLGINMEKALNIINEILTSCKDNILKGEIKIGLEVWKKQNR